jgi:hypothetical protein
MASNIKLTNTHGKTISIVGDDSITQDISISSSELSIVKTDNIVNLANGTFPTYDPLVSGQLWNNSGVVTVSAG